MSGEVIPYCQPLSKTKTGVSYNEIRLMLIGFDKGLIKRASITKYDVFFVRSRRIEGDLVKRTFGGGINLC